jgi:hypothetical protein
LSANARGRLRPGQQSRLPRASIDHRPIIAQSTSGRWSADRIRPAVPGGQAFDGFRRVTGRDFQVDGGGD